MLFEFLETERLTFRPFNKGDLTFLIELLTNDSVCKYLPGEGAYSLEVCGKYLQYFMMTFNKKNHNRVYLVTKKDTQEPIGYCGIQIVNEFSKYELFYAYIPKSWGNGFATEATLKMKELAKNLSLSEIIGLADIHNLGSQKVLEKTGLIKKTQLPLWGLNLYYYELKL